VAPGPAPSYKTLEFRVKLGRVLIERGLISEEQLVTALRLQEKWGSWLGDILMAKGWIKPFDLAKALAFQFRVPFVNLMEDPPDGTLFQKDYLETYATKLFLPWKVVDGQTWVVTAAPEPETWDLAKQLCGPDIQIAITSKFDIIWQLQRLANEHYSQKALNDLRIHDAKHSAATVFTVRQLALGYGAILALVAWLVIDPVRALTALNTFFAVSLFMTFALRAVLSWVGCDPRVDVKVTDEEVRSLVDAELPTYTVLVPMYKEPDVLPILANALRNMDYPLSKLDIKLVLESDDIETIDSAKALKLEPIFEIIRVPYSIPKTKPKACNYALQFSRGELTTIFDAEDKPEPDQLKKAVMAFMKSPSNTACIQGRLNYFNAEENWLTRMFTLEYSQWFDVYLPALEALGIPIPLGGTSNNFKTDILRRLRAWDPYNVTEDADLGMRFRKEGYRVGVVNSTTFEEANTSIPNWIRQRSRWIKGYMQTYLVHMRHPIDLYRSVGHTGFWGLQFFIGGTFFAALVFPILVATYIFWLLTRSQVLDVFFPPAVLYLSLFNLLVGNGCLIYVSMLGAFKRGYYRLVPFALTAPLYWALMSVSGYKAFWQLLHNPFFWEKTVHGLSKHTAAELEKAKEAAA
jgi:cellulose synthase/poly-beta-1,6-N-acetylglucosamine synthase-like glycosyltransferase